MVPWEKAKKRKRWEEDDAGVNVEDREDSVLSLEKEKIKKLSVIEFRLFQLCSHPFFLFHIYFSAFYIISQI